MNDDFLRRVRRPPPPAFASQLKERLRQLEVAESSRRRPNWRLLTIPLLIGGTVLAAATYMGVKHLPLLSAPPSEVAQMPTADAPQARSNAGRGVTYRANSANIAAPEAWADPPSTASDQPPSSTSNTRDDSQSSAESATGGVAGLSGFSTSTRTEALTDPPVRVVLAHDVATIMDISRNKPLSDDVEVTSTDAAFRALCAESPTHRRDVIFASRPIQEKEVLSCSEREARGLLVAKVGHMAMVITGAKDSNPLRNPMRLSRDALLRALLKRIPSPDDPARLIDNPYTHWNQIDPSLDDRRIEVLGPPRDSLQFVVFAATLLEPACDKYPVIRNLQRKDRGAYEDLCFSLREDGAYTPAPLDGNFVRQRLWSNPGALAVVDYRFYSGNSADLLGSLLTGATPTLESIMDGRYAGARTVHLYVTRARYDGAPAVKSFIDTYLRKNHFAQHRLLILPNGETHWWKARPAQLTDVRLETQRK